MNQDDMKRRTMEYALRICKLAGSLPRNKLGFVVEGQLIRSGSSVAANYRAACRGRSKAEFVAKLGIVEEETDETIFWMEFVVHAKRVKAQLVADLLREGNEILRIVVSSVRTARSRTAQTIRNPKSAIRNQAGAGC